MVKCLEAEGVDILFGYPGAAICPFYDALYESPIRHVLVRSEQNAAHMASGYARASRQARGVRGHLRPRGHQFDHRDRHGVYGFHPHYRHHRPGEPGTAGPGRVPRGGHHRRLRVLHQAQLPGEIRGRPAPGVQGGLSHCLHRPAGTGAHRRARGRAGGPVGLLPLPGAGGHSRVQPQDHRASRADQAGAGGHPAGPTAGDLLWGAAWCWRVPGRR